MTLTHAAQAAASTTKAERLRRLSTLLDQALDLDAPAREAWLAGLDAESAMLGPTLRKLLARDAAQEVGALLDRGPDFTAPRDVAQAGALQSGDMVGPYRLLRELGRGGMGEVWLADRVDGSLKRQVALKLPTLGIRRAVLVQRFARERDILASLAHPNIARLYDAGIADDGQPYLALELVNGVPITAYCEQQALDQRARVQLMRQVMDAVQFAHAHLVIHRDIKPGNVLVTPQGQAMLLDFGVAKLLHEDQAQAEETALTQAGGRALTLDYAAPEQVAGLPVSTATDVYALGVLLHELLAGERPFRGTKRDVEQAILTQEPPRQRSLPADLATIVLKALKKAPAERYATADAFAEDLGRWLRGEPVVAQPDRLGYRMRRFITRHRLPVVMGTLVALALVTTGAVALRQAVEARKEAARAQQEAQRAHAVQAFLLDLFKANSTTQADPQAAQRTTARDLLDRGAARIDAALADVPQSRLEVMGTLGDMYAQLGLNAQASQMQSRRVELARRTFGNRDARLAQVLLDYIETLQESSRRGEISALLDEALAVLDATGEQDSPVRVDALLVSAHYWRYESLQRARQRADEAVAYLDRVMPNSDALVTAHVLAARARINAYDHDGGVEQATLAIAVARRQGEGSAAWLSTPIATLADALQGQMQYDQAAASVREEIALNAHVHGELHPDTLLSKLKLGNLLLTVGQSTEGRALHAAVREAMKANDPRFDAAWRSYAGGQLDQLLMDRGRPDLLAPSLRKEVDDLRRTLPHSPLLAHRERLWAEVQAALGDFGAARATLAAAQSHWRAFAAGVDTVLVDSVFALSRARVELAAGNPAEALAQLDPARPASRAVAIAREVERALALLALDRAADALAASDAALQDLARLPVGGRPVVLEAEALERRGLARRALGDVATARASLLQALALRRANDASGSRALARIERTLTALPRH